MNNKSFKIFTTITYIISLVLLTIIAYPLIDSFISGEPEIFSSFIEGFGPFSIVIMLFMQIAQVIVALIPGELVEFLAGTLYGWLGGLIFCLVGVFIGQSIIFITIRLVGSDFKESKVGKSMLGKYKFLQSESKLRTAAFILYFIPGTPKDLLAYVFPLTKIKFWDFTVISITARIPSIVSSTLGGKAFAEKNYLALLIIYLAIGAISVIGGLIGKKIVKYRNNNSL